MKGPCVATLLTVMALLPSCGATPPSVELGRPLDAPAVYRVSASTESRLSGPASGLETATDLVAVFEVTPTSTDEVEVEALQVAASTRNSRGEPVALDVGPLRGETATVRFGSPGVASEVSGSRGLLRAQIPLVPMEGVVRDLFPALPEGAFREGDTWTGDAPVPFASLGDEPPVRMRYVLTDARSREEAAVEGYELAVEPRSFRSQTPVGGVSGEGDLEVEFDGELDTEGYERTERTAEFESDFLRLEGGGFANGTLRMSSTTTVERLSSAEIFGLDLR